MRIGVFVEGSPEDGGGFQLEMAILDGLRQVAPTGGHEYIVLAPRDVLPFWKGDCPGAQLFELERPGIVRRVGHRLVRSFRGMSPDLRSRVATQAQELIQRHHIELMYYPSPSFRCLDHDTPYVLTVYDLQHRLRPEFPEVSARGKWVARERFYAEAIPRAFVTIVATSVLKDDVVRFYGVREDRVRVLPYVPGPSVTGQPEGELDVRAKYGIPDGFLFYPARFWPHKNHAGLLYALQILREKESVRLSLVLVGSDKGNLAYLRRLLGELGLEEQVYIVGFVSDAEMAALYRRALALVMPTFFGPTNLPPLEAFALGCPVITSNIPGCQEQFGDAAVLVDPTDPADIARGILRVHKDTAFRQDLIVRGRQVVGRWAAEDYAKALVEIFEGMAPIRRCWAESQ
jgi:glycosyltransferase involved in cell wall biosynthesis